MKRNAVLGVVAVVTVLMAVSPAFAAAPFGSFGGKVGGGNSGFDSLGLHGWALDDNGVHSVDILVDGVVAGRAHYGRTRPGVTANFPGFPNSAAPGFVFALDTTQYLNGLHTVQARVRSNTGEFVTLSPSRVFEFLNNAHNLDPFGKLEFPGPNADITGNCNQSSPRRYSVIEGYAVDSGVDQQDTGVGYVELLIDRALWLNTNRDCTFDLATGGLTNCYGFVRTDVERIYPLLNDSLHSGFRFVLDIGALIGSGLYTRGHHTFSIRAGDRADQDAQIAELSVIFNCAEDFPNEPAVGDISGIRPGLSYGGIVNVVGFALDIQGIGSVQITVDGRFIGNATYGLPDARASSRYPGYPNSALPGFTFALDTRTLSNGVHFVTAFATDLLGVQTRLAERRIVVANPE